MKKIIFSAAILLSSTAIFAQSDNVQPNVVKLNLWERFLAVQISVLNMPSMKNFQW